ncbi:MAG: Arc family DNA-binding protein [Clostridia bacterium]|nr:Arc family DNA-binding protein [Clostridia bacterium]MDY3784429.1 Arc family DNA-binding protein [Eubacteriales bacterium]
MRNKSNKHLGIEIDPELHQKIKYIAEYEGRSINGQILYLVRQCIKKFETENGKIEIDPDGKKQ